MAREEQEEDLLWAAWRYGNSKSGTAVGKLGGLVGHSDVDVMPGFLRLWRRKVHLLLHARAWAFPARRRWNTTRERIKMQFAGRWAHIDCGLLSNEECDG